MVNDILYKDSTVILDAAGLTIRWYYFPLGTSKRILYSQIRGVHEHTIGPFTGMGRLWGSGDFSHWAPLDIHRLKKEKSFIFDLGTKIKPVITPDDPTRFLALLQERIVPQI